MLEIPDMAQATAPRARLDRIDLDFRDSDTGYLTHSIHPYPAKFIPQIPNALIREFTKVGDTVADVFCGSGTTLVEALLLGRNAIGVDANPLACLISAAKTSRLGLGDRAALMGVATKADQLAADLVVMGESSLWKEHPFKSAAPRPDSEALSFWFDAFVVEELAEVLSWCQGLSSETARTVALVAFSSIVVNVSHQDSDTRYVRRNKNLVPGDAALRFARAIRSAAAAVEEFTARVPEDVECHIHLANILEKPAVADFDLLVCSPPYPNAFSYHLYHMTRMLWLGLDQRRFKAEEIGSHRKYSSKGPNRATAETFRNEMSEVLTWVSRHMKHLGLACFVVGDSTIRGSRISNADLISDAATEVGFQEVARKLRRLDPTKKAFNPTIGRIKNETVLVLQKQGM